MGTDMRPDEQPQPDVAADIVAMFKAEATRAETERRAAGLMRDAINRAVDRVLTALTVVNLSEWRERSTKERRD